MLSPFTGISLITHLFICFLYKTALFFYRLFFGFKKNKNAELTILVRARDENILPPMIIGFICSVIFGVAVASVGIGYRSTPNTFDLVASAMDTTQTYEAPKAKDSPREPQFVTPTETEETMIALKNYH